MRYVYFCLYRFFRCCPSKAEASELAAVFVPVFFVSNILMVFFSTEGLLGAHVDIPHGKMIFGGSGLCLAMWSYWWYELSGRGKEIIATFSGSTIDRRSVVIGGMIFAQSLLGGVLFPAIIAVIKNPTPWMK